MRKIFNSIVFYLFTYPAGIVIGLTVIFLESLGLLEVDGWGNFPRQRGRILMVSNHPSLVEPILLIGLFFHQYVLRPKYGPWTMVDTRTYFTGMKRVLAPFLQSRLIPVDREIKNGDMQSLEFAKNLIAEGANILVLAEGGRTWKGKRNLQSRKGKELRPLKSGFAQVAAFPGVVLIPVWVEFDGWRHVRLIIGKEQKFEGVQRKEIVRRTEQLLLDLADSV